MNVPTFFPSPFFAVEIRTQKIHLEGKMLAPHPRFHPHSYAYFWMCMSASICDFIHFFGRLNTRMYARSLLLFLFAASNSTN